MKTVGCVRKHQQAGDDGSPAPEAQLKITSELPTESGQIWTPVGSDGFLRYREQAC